MVRYRSWRSHREIDAVEDWTSDCGCTRAHESARVAALRRYDILDTPPDGSFDHIAAIAAKLFDVPIAIVSLVDHDRIWFKARHGIDVEQIEREPGLCASAILQAEPYVLTDASCDPRSLTNPLVAGEFGLRFYVAAPLRTSDGHNLGTLCVIDHSPRTVTDAQITQLEALAAIVVDQMELRLAARNAVADLERRGRTKRTPRSAGPKCWQRKSIIGS